MSALIASFPAAGSGGETLGQLEKLAVRRGMAYLALANPPSIDAFASGQWQAESVEELRRAAATSSAPGVILVGHCMGGFSAVRLSDGLGAVLGLPVSILLINTPCPDLAGRIPTMSQFSDAQIADVLAHDGFPQDLLDDEDMLGEIADGLRNDARVADRVAEWVSTAGTFEALHVLATRGDFFIPPEHCAEWWARVKGEFHLTVANGGHTIDDDSVRVLERAVDCVLASTSLGPSRTAVA
jgi:surfactin synthase thioesterase subunit